jgi:AraC-like DNA-binding protein
VLKLHVSDFFRAASQFVVVEPRSPQVRFPLHEHDFYEIVIVSSGNGWHVLNDEPHFISCGEVLFLRAEDHHAFEEVDQLHLTNILYRPNGALLHPDRIRPYLQPTPADEDASERRYWQLSDGALQGLEPLLTALARESLKPDAASAVMAECLFAQLVVTLWRDRFATDASHLPASARLDQVLRYLRHNCTQPIDLDEVADRFGYSPRNLRRVFSVATATTPHSYLVKLRLAQAMRALRTTDDSVTGIALASGFNDSNYFAYCFKKQMGMSPVRYRQDARPRRVASPSH